MSKKTAVQWLIQKLHENSTFVIPKHWRQDALSIEENQISKAYDAGYENGLDEPNNYKGHDYFNTKYPQP